MIPSFNTDWSTDANLTENGFGHRRLSHSDNTGKHEIYELETGLFVGMMDCLAVIQWLKGRVEKYSPELHISSCIA